MVDDQAQPAVGMAGSRVDDASHGPQGQGQQGERQSLQSPTPDVLVVSPSEGLGGGIERYLDGLIEALTHQEISSRRVNLLAGDGRATTAEKLRFVLDVWWSIATAHRPTIVVFAHRGQLPLLRLCRPLPKLVGAVTIVHGSELWAGSCRIWRARYLRRRTRVVSVSSYTAGSLLSLGVRSSVLPPTVTHQWYETLITKKRMEHDGIALMTAFRLADWNDKGLPTIVEALELLRPHNLWLTVCGSGTAPPELVQLLAHHPWVRLRANLTDDDFADQLAQADVFVLATRTRVGAHASGEGFGLVLLEAQLAGTPVVAPAYGGGWDAFVPGLTGLAPADESPSALATVLRRLIDDPGERITMGHEARRWSQQRFDPKRYPALVAATICDRQG